MQYYSTRSACDPIPGHQAVIRGLGPDGGLYVPDDSDIQINWRELSGKTYQQIAEAVLTAFFPDYGSETIRECVASAYNNSFDDPEIVVNIQGDEPLIESSYIDAAVTALENSDCDWSTLRHPISAKEAENPNKVKVVCDKEGKALYFSRSVIPYARDNFPAEYFGHIGLYCYRKEALLLFSALEASPLEKAEKLEQLRALENGLKIVCATVPRAYPGIDTPEDLARAEKLLAEKLS